jgi:hypothetical protein
MVTPSRLIIEVANEMSKKQLDIERVVVNSKRCNKEEE